MIYPVKIVAPAKQRNKYIIVAVINTIIIAGNPICIVTWDDLKIRKTTEMYLQMPRKLS